MQNDNEYKDLSKDEWFERLYDEAIEAIERGWNIIPLSISSKRPLIEWAEYQNRAVTHEEVEDWFENGVPTKFGQRIRPFNIALVTGAVSGICVVDCDNERALKFAETKGMFTPFAVSTRRGKHFYFRHPAHGQRFANKVGGVGRDWPEIEGLDFRGDGGYVVMPPSAKFVDGEITHIYEWDIGVGLDWDDLDTYKWHGVPTDVEAPVEGEFSFGALNLEGTRIHNPDEGVPIWDQTKIRVAHLGRKLGEGDGTDALMVRFCGQKVRQGVTGDDLYEAVRHFHDEFFDESGYTNEQTEYWLAEKIKSAIEMDRRNYREDYDKDGNRIFKTEEEKKVQLGRLRPVFGSDVDRLLSSLGDTSYWADPLIPAETITQVVGYNGHGKSFFLSALLSSMSAGKESFGPYDSPKPAKVFYLDYDNPARTVLHRLSGFNKMFGNTGEHLAVWSPTLISSDNGGEMNLATEEGFKLLGEWLEVVKPDIVVIDTVRNAFGGMEEASAAEWFKVNHVAKSVRTKFKASVVLVHHRNKPGESGLGREAGSTAQLTDIDTQIMVTQVFRDKQDAKSKAGLTDADLSVRDINDREWTPFGYLEQRLEPDSRIKMVSQISFGKVRQQTEMHQTHYIGWAERLLDGSQYVVSTASPKQKALYFAQQGMDAKEVSRKLSLPVYEVEQWLN
jgi:hypothetical protein